MARVNQIDIVDEIKSRCNIVDVVGRVVTLKKAGINYKGLCPFHNEKTPSFIVSEKKQNYTCYGCGKSGDVINFVQEYYHLDFKEACRMLGKEYGIEVTFGSGKNSKLRERYQEINAEAARFFYKALREKQNPGLTYMAGRGLTQETLKEFNIGYADDEWESLTKHLLSKGYKGEELLDVGLCSKGKNGKLYDKFRSRVIFPIRNAGGKFIGFGGRIIGEGEPKYLNSQESVVFQKKDNLYGLNLSGDYIRKEDAIILVEGYMDVISLYQHGIKNVSASLGTALTEHQARLIKRYTKNVILSYDADEAGQNAAMRGLDVLYKEDCKAKVLKVNDGKDPDEFVKANGREAFLKLADEALPYGDFKLARTRRNYNLKDEQQRIDYIREAVQVIRGMKPVEADLYIKKLSAETGSSEVAISREVYESSGKNRPAPEPSRETQERPTSISVPEKNLLKLMLIDSEFLELPEGYGKLAFREGPARDIYRAIVSADEGFRPMNLNRIRDSIDPGLLPLFDGIERIPIPPGKERAMFKESLEALRTGELKRRYMELTEKIEIGETSGMDSETLAPLLKEQMEIQKLLK